MPLRGEKIIPESVYIALDARSEPGTYHYGLLITGLEGGGTLHHAVNRSGSWIYETRPAYPRLPISLVAMIRIGDLSNDDNEHIMEVIRSVPADGKPSQRTGEVFNCTTWLKDVLVALEEAGVVRLPMRIEALFRVAKAYGDLHSEEAELGRGIYVVNETNSKVVEFWC
ncbi:hypothetical protein VTI74DRAFT_10375 [Chaetomium olivicolor]